MTFDWQNVIALALVGTAVGYLCRLTWRIAAKSNRSKCGGCSSCSSQESSPQVVSIAGPGAAENKR